MHPKKERKLLENKVDQLVKLISNINRNLQFNDKIINSKVDTEEMYDDLVITDDTIAAKQIENQNKENIIEDANDSWSIQIASIENYYDFCLKNSDCMEQIMKKLLL